VYSDNSVRGLRPLGLFQERAAQILDLALPEGDMGQVARAYDWLGQVGVLRAFGSDKEAREYHRHPRLRLCWKLCGVSCWYTSVIHQRHTPTPHSQRRHKRLYHGASRVVTMLMALSQSDLVEPA